MATKWRSTKQPQVRQDRTNSPPLLAAVEGRHDEVRAMLHPVVASAGLRPSSRLHQQSTTASKLRKEQPTTTGFGISKINADDDNKDDQLKTMIDQMLKRPDEDDDDDDDNDNNYDLSVSKNAEDSRTPNANSSSSRTGAEERNQIFSSSCCSSGVALLAEEASLLDPPLLQANEQKTPADWTSADTKPSRKISNADGAVDSGEPLGNGEISEESNAPDAPAPFGAVSTAPSVEESSGESFFIPESTCPLLRYDDCEEKASCPSRKRLRHASERNLIEIPNPQRPGQGDKWYTCLCEQITCNCPFQQYLHVVAAMIFSKKPGGSQLPPELINPAKRPATEKRN